MTYLQAIIFGIVQGVTELFPISSLGHSVVLPKILGWHINQQAPFFLTFLVFTHTATALVLFLFFWKDWKRIILGLFRSLREREIRRSDTDARLAWLLIVATIPAGVLGLLLEDPLQNLFAAPQLVAFTLILNGVMLLAAEKLQRRKKEAHSEKESDTRIAKLNWLQAVIIGLLQSIALIPGFSRTGASLTGGLLSGLSHEDAARFSFLLATPIIGAASVLKLSEVSFGTSRTVIGPMLAGSVFAGIFAFLSVKFLVKYFETKKLWPFGMYCIVIGVVLSLVFSL